MRFETFIARKRNQRHVNIIFSNFGGSNFWKPSFHLQQKQLLLFQNFDTVRQEPRKYRKCTGRNETRTIDEFLFLATFLRPALTNYYRITNKGQN